MFRSANALLSIVDDDPFVCAATRSLAKAIGLDARVFMSAACFLDSDAPPLTRCLICDAGMPGLDGIELLARLESRGLYIPTLFIAASGSAPVALPARAARPLCLLEKPVDAWALEQWIRRALKYARSGASR
ncbi:response regulator [Trinickia caryophylli]|uniref:response regulator n=1 Tax=Trinickia caryophylli TaxID=28094 RepID=UPI001E4707B1|nr:response regulator [Trinickia caryophylli]WQE10491.1 response regulator [Trinickia caryophylli]GLU32845.1 response regulator [Trinickia caryophylli]